MLKSHCSICLLAAAASLAVVGSARGDAYLVDVWQESYNSTTVLGEGVKFGQTFTAGRDGELASLLLWGRKGAGHIYGRHMTARLHAVENDGTLAETPLAEELVASASLLDDIWFIPVSLDTPYQQYAGEKLAIVIEYYTAGASGSNELAIQTGNPYAGGAAFTLDSSDPFGTAPQYKNYDLKFSTATVFPEPTSAIIAGAPALLMLARRRRRA